MASELSRVPLPGRYIGILTNSATSRCSDLEQLLRLAVARGRGAVLAGGDAGQRGDLPPAECRPGLRELFAHRAIVLLGVQCAVFAGGEPDQPVADRPRLTPRLG